MLKFCRAIFTIALIKLVYYPGLLTLKRHPRLITATAESSKIVQSILSTAFTNITKSKYYIHVLKKKRGYYMDGLPFLLKVNENYRNLSQLNLDTHLKSTISVKKNFTKKMKRSVSKIERQRSLDKAERVLETSFEMPIIKIDAEKNLTSCSYSNESRQCLETQKPIDEITNSNSADSLTPRDFHHSDDSQVERFAFGCKGRCWSRASLPCGCSAACVVYGNCCDNIAKDCPDVVHEAVSKYSELFDVDVLCDEDSIFKIMSCPKTKQETSAPQVSDHESRNSESYTEQQGGGFLPDDLTILKGQLFRPDISDETIQKFDKALLLSAPLTHAATGFTFVNRSIFECHKAFTRGVILWTLQMKYNIQSPSNLKDLESSLAEDSKYIPTFDTKILHPHLCVPNLIWKCSDTTTSAYVDPDSEEKCRNSMAMVISFHESPRYYANIFCAYCNEGQHGSYFHLMAHHHSFRDNDIRVLMTLTPRANYALTLKNEGDKIVPWISAVCSVFSGTGSRRSAIKQTNCSTVCSKGYSKSTSDGKCKAEYMALVGVADEGYPLLCQSSLAALGNFIVCGLKHLLPSLMHADFAKPIVQIKFDTRAKKTIYLINVKMDLFSRPKFFFSDQLQESWKNFQRLTMLAKSFKSFRKSHSLCAESGNKRNTSRTEINSAPITSHMWFHTWEKAKDARKSGGGEIGAMDTTTVCSTHTFSVNDNNTDFVLFCSEQSIHDIDEEALVAFSKSRCHNLDPELQGKNGHLRETSTGSCWQVLLLGISFIYVVSFGELV